MSSFEGQMHEYNSISIDRFDGNNLNSSVFMLSHNHSDHTVGLSSVEFQYRLQNNSALKLYCSVITRDLLLLEDRYAPIWNSIVPLEIDCPHVLDIPDVATGKVKKTVVITLLQAGHCPGSVMFLFEGDEGAALYTGDFRLTKEEISSFSHLHAPNGSVKELKSIYVDTTFCVPKAFFIPRREDCIDGAIEVVQDWISRDKDHLILLSYKADIGYERLFVCLSEKFGMKIHVHKAKFEQYKKVGNLGDYITSDPAETQIHACRWTSGQRKSGAMLPCGFGGNGLKATKLRTIVLSTMCFVQTVGLDTYAKRFSDTFFRVCYSFHSSYSEIRDMILYLKPEQAFPNVIPIYDDPSLAQVQKRLNGFVKLAKKTHQSALYLSSGQFGLLKSPKGKNRKRSSQQSHTSGSLKLIFDEDEHEGNTPKKKKLVGNFVPPSTLESKVLNSDFPLLFGDQDNDGDALACLGSSNSDVDVKSSPTEGALEKNSANCEHPSDSQDELTTSEEFSSGKEDSLAHLFDADLLISYISDDESNRDHPVDATPQNRTDVKPHEDCVPLCTEKDANLDSQNSNVVDQQQENVLKLKTELSAPATNPVPNGLHSSSNSQNSDFSDVQIIDDNSAADTVNRKSARLDEAGGCLNSSRTVDSDVTVDIGCSPYKICSSQSVSSSVNPAFREDELIDLTADEEPTDSSGDFDKNNRQNVSFSSDRRGPENQRHDFNSDFDSASDDYEGDDEFEEMDEESGYDSDAEIIISRKSAFESVIKERALRYSRTAVNSSDIIVIDDDDLSDSAMNYQKGRRRDVRYCSAESSSSSSSTESLLSDNSRGGFLDAGAMLLKSSSDELLMNSAGKPRLWFPQPRTGAPGVAAVASSEDLYSS